MSSLATWLSEMSAVLQYGMAGASLVFLVLAFLLLGAQKRRSSSRSKTLSTQSFMRLCAWAMAFSLAGAALDVLKDRVPSIARANEKTIARLQNENLELLKDRQALQSEKAKHEAMTRSTRDQLESEIGRQKSEYERTLGELQQALDDEKASHAADVERQSRVLVGQQRLIEWAAAQRIGDSLNEAAGTTAPGSSDDAFYKALRRAVFLNVMWFGAQEDTLRSSLALLQKRDPKLTDELIDRIAREFPKIRGDRHRWLKDKAMPGLQRDVNYLKAHPLEQRTARAAVDLPKEYSLAPEISKAQVTDMAWLDAEKRKLEEPLR